MSAVVQNEPTHTRKNHREFSNVTDSLTEKVNKTYDLPNRRRNRARADHSLDKKVAQPLGKRKSVNTSAGKMDSSTKQGSKVDLNELNKQKAKKILDESKEESIPVKIETPEISSGFILEDIIKGKG